MVKIAPSTDPIKNLKELVAYCKEIENDADFLHVDIMDGLFVENKTFGHVTVEKINQNTLLMLDVHLMEKNPQPEQYIKAGANVVTVHYESYNNNKKLKRALKKIKKLKALAGLSVKPQTPIEKIFEFLPLCDVVLIMSVEPGKSGQTFLETTYSKIEILKRYINSNNLNVKIEVDGGVNASNSGKLKLCGADILVSGNFVYSSSNRKDAINSLRK